MSDEVEIDCFDQYDEPIEYYTQWDVDQTMRIVLHNYKKEYLAIPPEVHFANGRSKEAFVANSTVDGDDTIVVDIPDAILTFEYPMLVYVYMIDKNDPLSKRTIATTEIPIHKRAKPGDYHE